MYEEMLHAVLHADAARLDALVAQDRDALFIVTQDDHWNLLHRALLSTSHPPAAEIVRMLVGYGLEVNARDGYGNTPLHYAARWKSVELIGILLDAGAEIDAANKDGLTPLRLMLRTKPFKLDAVELFLSRGADPNERSTGGRSVMEYARIISHDDTAGLIAVFEKYAKRNTGAGPAQEGK
jgi:ankyrin repeat protein